MYVPRSKTVSSRRDPLAGGALDDTPINEYGCVSLLKNNHMRSGKEKFTLFKTKICIFTKFLLPLHDFCKKFTNERDFISHISHRHRHPTTITRRDIAKRP